jgi:predicted transcriptional regulator
MSEDDNSLLDSTASVVAAFAANQKIAPGELQALIATVHKTLASLSAPQATAPEPIKLSAAQIRKSVTPDALISFEDGKAYKTLKRHLTTRGLTLAEYKAKWGLPHDYPTTAPSYSARRSAMAKSLGLGSGGRKPTKRAAPAAKAGPAAPAKRGRGRPRKTTS